MTEPDTTTHGSTQDGASAQDLHACDYFKGSELLANPYPWLARMRETGPVQREPHHDVVMITGYEEAASVYTDPERFSSCLSITGPFPGFPVPLEGDDVSALIEQHRDALPMSDQLPTMDVPEHTRQRAILMSLITPRRLKENEEFVWRLADEQLDALLSGASGELVNGYGNPFAMLVIADLLGVPREDHDDFKRALLKGTAKGGGIGSTGSDTLSHSPLQYLYEVFTSYITDRRENPREDVLTGLAKATFPDGSTPPVEDVVRIASNLFAAGQETTVRLLSFAVQILADDQELQSRLRADRSLIPNFLEEVLRLESPIKGDFRLSKVPVNVGGVDLPAGTTVYLANCSANRDPRQFDSPDELKLDRVNPRNHLAFGRGPHTCPGSPLARTEARVTLERLLDRTTSFSISEEHHGPAGARTYRYLPTFILRGLVELHLTFEVAEG
jgi:cytochrome P450